MTLRRTALPGRSGFTLIELLVVSAIVGILASLFIAKIQRAVRMAREAQARCNLDAMRKTIDMYAADNAASSSAGYATFPYPTQVSKSTNIPGGSDTPVVELGVYFPRGCFFENPIDGSHIVTPLNFVWNQNAAHTHPVDGLDVIGAGTDGYVYFIDDHWMTLNSADVTVKGDLRYCDF